MNANQVLEELGKEQRIKDQTLFYHLYSQEKERRELGGSEVWKGARKEAIHREGLSRDVHEVMGQEQGTALLWFSEPRTKEADAEIMS